MGFTMFHPSNVGVESPKARMTNQQKLAHSHHPQVFLHAGRATGLGRQR